MKTGRVLLCVLVSGLLVGQSGDLAAGKRWWAHIEALAGDATEGRQTGSRGYDLAAEYVVQHLREYGLQPAGENGFLQPVKFEEERVLLEKCSAALVRDGKEEALRVPADLIPSSHVPEPEQVDAPLVFLGYGLHIPEANYDDFAGMDLRGKIVVVLNGGPKDVAAAVKSHAHSTAFWPALQRAGAVGEIYLSNPKFMDIPWSRLMLIASQTGMYLEDDSLRDVHGKVFSGAVSPDAAERLFAGSGHTYAEMLAIADAGGAMPRFPLKVSLRAKVASETRKVSSANLVAKLEGSDPKLKNEYVGVSAHLDHVGVGEPVKGDKIYHGAMDDASGVASVLEVARMIRERKIETKRSVLFLIFTAEEKGLLGSRYFANHPTVPHDQIVADINMDMPLPLFPFKRIMAPGIDESSLREDIQAVAATRGVEVVPDPYPDRQSFVRTDQYSFVRTGVPAVALKFGLVANTPEAKTEWDWRHQRYHSPEDNLSQPVDLEAAAQFDEFVLGLAERIADERERPKWREGSAFGREGR